MRNASVPGAVFVGNTGVGNGVAAPVILTIEPNGGVATMKPSELKVHQNDMVTISITTDTDGEVHLHGYDHAFDCKAGQVTAYSFRADKSGTFDIEWESTGAHLGDLVVEP